MYELDCTLIPGGGLLPNGALPPWTIARLDLALTMKKQSRWIGLLSGGTVHKPPPIDTRGYPIFESRQAAAYLIQAGLNPEFIFTEICSYDTIGNAYFSRLLLAEPLQFINILVITSAFHMPRTRAIFEWIYNLPPSSVNYQLSFRSVPDQGLSPQALAARTNRENNSLKQFEITRKDLTTLSKFQTWLYREHAAYAVSLNPEPINQDELKSY